MKNVSTESNTDAGKVNLHSQIRLFAQLFFGCAS